MRKFIQHTILFLLAALAVHGQQRIVTAGSASSEIVCALGFCDNIVATDQTSVYPEILQTLPVIGYRSGISAEGILSRNPDLIILEKEYVKEELISQLRSTGIKLLITEQKRNFEGTETKIQAIAAALDKEEEGRLLTEKIAGELAILRKKVSAGSYQYQPKVLCVYARGQGNMQVAGRNSAFTLTELAGTRNAVPEIEGYKPLNAESLILANPDYILFFESGLESIGGLEEALKISGVSQTTAGKRKQIIAMDGVLLTSWGPGVAQAASELYDLTHPKEPK